PCVERRELDRRRLLPEAHVRLEAGCSVKLAPEVLDDLLRLRVREVGYLVPGVERDVVDVPADHDAQRVAGMELVRPDPPATDLPGALRVEAERNRGGRGEHLHDTGVEELEAAADSLGSEPLAVRIGGVQPVLARDQQAMALAWMVG